MKKINEQQVELLFEFTRKHFVEYYDVQVELVDHLANGIEEQWLTQPNLTFDEALKIEFKKFGIFGFTDLVADKQSELSNYYYKLIWKEFKNFFNFPKVILTIGLLFFFYNVYAVTGENFTVTYLGYTCFMIALLVYCLIDNLMFVKKLKKIETDKKWLITGVSRVVCWTPLFLGFYLSNSLFGFFENSPAMTSSGLIIITLISTVNSLLFLIVKTKIKPLFLEEVKLVQKRFA